MGNTMNNENKIKHANSGKICAIFHRVTHAPLPCGHNIIKILNHPV